MAEFPILFRVEESERHEVMLVTSKYTVEDLKSTMDGLLATSANCAAFMGKYRGKGVEDKVTEVKTRWAAEGRDRQLYPKETLLTEDNCRAVLAMMAAGAGKDILVVHLQTSTAEK